MENLIYRVFGRMIYYSFYKSQTVSDIAHLADQLAQEVYQP